MTTEARRPGPQAAVSLGQQIGDAGFLGRLSGDPMTREYSRDKAEATALTSELGERPADAMGWENGSRWFTTPDIVRDEKRTARAMILCDGVQAQSTARERESRKWDEAVERHRQMEAECDREAGQ
jgi:hypothetical protein